jgi:hypothetical protein
MFKSYLIQCETLNTSSSRPRDWTFGLSPEWLDSGWSKRSWLDPDTILEFGLDLTQIYKTGLDMPPNKEILGHISSTVRLST